MKTATTSETKSAERASPKSGDPDKVKAGTGSGTASRSKSIARSGATASPVPAPSAGPAECTGTAAADAQPKPRGRPLSFDRDAALEKAMHVFWEHGYESASISELTAAMGITPPSLYSAFGDKQMLFLEAIERYALGPGGIGTRAMAEEPTARGAIQRLLTDSAEELTRPCHPRGCMVVMAATNCSVAAESVQDALARRRALEEAGIADRIQRGIDEGELPPSTDATVLTNFYASVYRGMSMQAKDGATHESLLATAAMAMAAWPVKAG